MKTSQIIICSAVALVSGLVCWYSHQQNVTMSMLIQARGADAQKGLRNEEGKLLTEKVAVTELCDAARKAQDNQLGNMRDARDKFNDARGLNRDAKKDWLAKRDELKQAQAALTQAQKERNEAMEFLVSLPLMDQTDDFESAIANLEETITKEVAKKKELTDKETDHDKTLAKSQETVAGSLAEYRQLEEKNNKFFQDYTKNEDEYRIINVKPDWHMVQFLAEPNSGLTAGDSIPLIVRRGDKSIVALRIVSIRNGVVTAEYKEADLPRGVRLKKGDVVIRQKPVGH